MPLWYKGFRCCGRRETILTQLGEAIEHHQIGRLFPVARVEKGWTRSGEFYLFLAVDSSGAGEMPDEFGPLSRLSCLSSPLPDFFTLDAIKKMSRVGAESRIREFVQRIPYHSPTSTSADDPFDNYEESPAELSEEDSASLEQMQRYDHLLYWLSVTGSGTWNLFRGACQAVGLEVATVRRLVRRLRLLGQVALAADGNRWSIAPAVFVRPDMVFDEEVYFLSGQRHPSLMRTLYRHASQVETLPQPHGDAPATVRFSTVNSDALRRTLQPLVGLIHDGGQVARRLAVLLPASHNWMDTLEVVSNVPVRMHDLRLFQGREFVPHPFDDRQSGLYEFRSLNAPDGPALYTLFYDAPRHRWLAGEWYGLRFLALQVDGTPCRVQYDQATGRLLVPHGWRWPELYERALVLASGRLPTHNRGWLLYEGIRSQLLEHLQPKLNLEVEEYSNA